MPRHARSDARSGPIPLKLDGVRSPGERAAFRPGRGYTVRSKYRR